MKTQVNVLHLCGKLLFCVCQFRSALIKHTCMLGVDALSSQTEAPEAIFRAFIL